MKPLALVHCRDKIEFNLKSQKLEEPVSLFWQQTRSCGGMKILADRVRQSTGILNFLQLSRCLRHSRRRGLQPVWWRGAETIKHSIPGKRFFQHFGKFFRFLRGDRDGPHA
jgi:hypothetical protein